jgi:hypothetical protein
MKQRLRPSAVVVSLILLSVSPVRAQEQDEIDLSQIVKEAEKKSLSVGGFLEFQPSLVGLDRDSFFYQLRFPDQGPQTVGNYDFRLRLEGSYEKRAVGLHFTGDGLLRKRIQGWDSKATLFEGYLALRPSPQFTLDVGKKTTKWGKGYAWNPVSFVDRPKDPEDPLEALEGFYVLSADITRSFQGPLKTLAFTPVLVPVTESFNSSFGKSGHLNFAGKVYFLLWNTDIDFLFLTGESRTARYGFDFSRNLKTNLEVHAEWAWMTEVERTEISQNEQFATTVSGEMSTLVGLRYLTVRETNFIVEYYHNGAGFSQEEFEAIFIVAESPSADPWRRAGTSVETLLLPLLENPNPLRNYLYFRTSQKEPFDILYLTPEFTSIFNLDDGSFQVMPGVAYSPLTNLQMRLRGIFLVGGERTEFGEKQSDYRIELRVRYFF